MQEVYHILFIILPNYSAVVDVYVLNFLGVYGFRGLVQQWAVKEFYYCCTCGFESGFVAADNSLQVHHGI
jgi:hypothetical protein